jgi:hypothetical protein
MHDKKGGPAKTRPSMVGEACLQLDNPGGFREILIQKIILRGIDEPIRAVCKPLQPIF